MNVSYSNIFKKMLSVIAKIVRISGPLINKTGNTRKIQGFPRKSELHLIRGQLVHGCETAT